jgi:ketosteroid isomerase-like protein
LDAFDAPRFELEKLLDAGDGVVEVVRLRTCGRQGGVDVQQQIACVYSMCDGLISEQVIYLGPAEAFAAAGLTRSGARTATDIN